MRAGSDLRSVERVPFGVSRAGRPVESYLLRNASGVEVSFLDYGGIIRSIRVPDRRGVFRDVTPGYDAIDGYLADSRFFGALVGRVANRIADGTFTLDGTAYSLPRNDGANHLHGGPGGLHQVMWRVAPFSTNCSSGAALTYVSVAGEEGYPGTLEIRVTYTLTDNNELRFEYEATTDQATPVNLTQHTYFNLAGHDAGSVLAHELTLNASRYTPIDARRIPTGDLRTVRGTPFDFTTPRAIGRSVAADDEQLEIGDGYDHNWVIDTDVSRSTTLAARVVDSLSGRTLEIETTEPGIQFYAGNGLAGGPAGKNGHVYTRHSAFALETQHFPDSPNEPKFPSTLLKPGEKYHTVTKYKLSVI